MFQTLSNWYGKFEDWVHSWFPGVKTRITTALGTLAMGAATFQQYITGLPATKWITQETLTGVAAILFTVSFWFSNMGNRVDARNG